MFSGRKSASEGIVQDNMIGIIASMFESNAGYGAEHGACRCITQSTFLNTASDGSSIYIKFNISSVVINCSQFHHNVASTGGVLWTQDVNNNIISYDASLRHNRA